MCKQLNIIQSHIHGEHLFTKHFPILSESSNLLVGVKPPPPHTIVYFILNVHCKDSALVLCVDLSYSPSGGKQGLIQIMQA